MLAEELEHSFHRFDSGTSSVGPEAGVMLFPFGPGKHPMLVMVVGMLDLIFSSRARRFTVN